MKSVQILFVFGCLGILFSTPYLSIGEEVKMGTLELVLFYEPSELRHCETYTMQVAATLKNPPKRSEAKKDTAVWDLKVKAKIVGQNPPERQIYNVCCMPDKVDENVLDDLGDFWGKPWEKTWTVYKYNKIPANEDEPPSGKNTQEPYHDYVRGSYYKTPGNWETTYSIGFSVPDRNNPQKRYVAKEVSQSYSTKVSAPMLYVHSVEGFFGVTPLLNMDHLKNGVIKPLQKEIEKSKITNMDASDYEFFVEEKGLIKYLSGIVPKIVKESDCDCNKIALIGYSYGGHQVIKIADKIKEKNHCKDNRCQGHGIDIDLLVTIDPVRQQKFSEMLAIRKGIKKLDGNYGFTTPAEVKRHVNLYQQVDEGSLLGIPVWGGPIANIPAGMEEKFGRNTFIQFYKGIGRIKDGEDIPAGKLTSHIFIPYLQEVRSRIETEVKKAVPK